MNAQTTLNSAIAAGFDKLSPRDVMLCLLYGVSSGGVQHGTGSPVANSVTANPGTLYINDTDATIWAVVNGVWHQEV